MSIAPQFNPGPGFMPWPKTPRISKSFFVTITEKLDGTNAQFTIVGGEIVSVGSRNRHITPGKETDNYGFAGWVERNASELVKLGDGRHYGEWYGNGIQIGYGLDHKRFALFDARRWRKFYEDHKEGYDNGFPNCLEVVPVLYQGSFTDRVVNDCMARLETAGSVAVPGFMRPEGIIVEMNGERAKHTFMHQNGKWLA
jgi:hypothetical protein